MVILLSIILEVYSARFWRVWVDDRLPFADIIHLKEPEYMFKWNDKWRE
jgi:hypothetical protein